MGLPAPPCPSYLMNRGKGLPTAQRIRRGGAYAGKQVMRLVNHDMIRDLLVPCEGPNIYPAVLQKCEFERIKKNAKTMSAQEKIAHLQEQEAQRKQKVAACLARQANFQGAMPIASEDPCRKPNYALVRAYELRQEEDDNMKRFSRLVLGSKCHAIRDAQLAEKCLLKRELEAEEQRLEAMMEQRRRQCVRRVEEERCARGRRALEHGQQLKEQMRDNETARLLHSEQMAEECRRLQAAAVQLKLEEIEARKQKVCHQEKVRADLLESNRQVKHFRQLEEQEDKIAELKIQEFHRKKAAWEDERALQQRAQALAHNQAYASLWARQEKTHCAKESINELNEQRMTDEIERQWRRREQEECRRRAEGARRLAEERAAQLQDQRCMRALQMAREKQEFENVLKVQRAAALREDENECRRKQENEKHLRIILSQMTEKECGRIRAKQESFEEAAVMKLQEDCHNRQINELMCKKIQDLKAHNVPEIYIKEVERQMNRTRAK